MEYLGRQLRRELKFYIDTGGYHTLRARLSAIAAPDPHMKDPEGYLVTSLYFDDIRHSAMEEKAAGVQFRKKFRLRCYNRSDARILLECKRKYNEFISKEAVPLSRGEYDSILAGEYGFLLSGASPLCRELYARHHAQLLRPVVTVEYLREAYVTREGGVRITFDKDVSAFMGGYDMFSGEARRVLEPGQLILELKYDSCLPDTVVRILKTVPMERCAISKYVMCREEKRRLLFR